MKLLRVFSLLMGIALALSSCSDDKEAPLIPLYPYDDVVITITEAENTSTSCTFNLSPSDPQAPYLCLYVPQDVFSEVAKKDLPAFLMKDLQKQAQEAGTDYATFIAQASLTGEQTVRLDNLTPGANYELVTFAVSGVKPAKKPSFLYFQTRYIDMIDCTIEVQNVRMENGNLLLDVSPSVKDEYWYLAALPKANYDNLIQAYTKEDLFMILFSQQADGWPMEDIIGKLLKKGDATVGFKGVTPDIGECVWMAALMKTFGENSLILASQISIGEFNPANLTRSSTETDHADFSMNRFFNGNLPMVRIAKP